MNQIRLLPLLMIAIASLLTLKLAGMWFGEGQEFQGVVSAYAQSEDAGSDTEQAAANAENGAAEIVAGEDAEQSLETHPDQIGEHVGAGQRISPAREAILARLGQRREALDAYQRELELRESLLKATESRLQEKLEELKAVEARIQNAIGEREEEQQAQLAGLVVMYENMKAKDAAALFEEMAPNFAAGFLARMRPDTAASVLAGLRPTTAYSISVIL
ncbi:MAG: hypothetical protein JKY32_14540, partial [Rhizobiales bacterium]|nr:hypothetical protein [Hyphomicrobiales bacterium]